MIRRNNFSGNISECFKMGKQKFIDAHKGKYNGDINDLWAEIETKAKELIEPLTKKPKNK